MPKTELPQTDFWQLNNTRILWFFSLLITMSPISLSNFNCTNCLADSSRCFHQLLCHISMNICQNILLRKKHCNFFSEVESLNLFFSKFAKARVTKTYKEGPSKNSNFELLLLWLSIYPWCSIMSCRINVLCRYLKKPSWTNFKWPLTTEERIKASSSFQIWIGVYALLDVDVSIIGHL